MSAPTLCYSPAINPSHPLMRGVVGRWKVLPWYASGPRLIDISGFNHPGALTNGPTWAGRSVGGFGSVSFDGTDDVIAVPYAASLGVTTDYTVAFWTYVTTDRSFDVYFTGRAVDGVSADIEIYSAADTQGFTIVHNRGGTLIYVTNDQNSGSPISDVGNWADVPLNAWVHVAVTYANSSALKVYFNGVQRGNSITGVGAPPNSSNPTYFGGRTGFSSTTDFLLGKLDDMCLFNRALSASEVRQLYDATSRRDDPTLSWIRPATYFGVTAGGTTYSVSVSEAAAATETVSCAAVFPSTVAESGTATDTPSCLAVFASTLTEAGSASEATSAQAVFASTITEGGSAADTATCGAVFACTASESATATDTLTTTAVFGVSLTEAGLATDTVSAPTSALPGGSWVEPTRGIVWTDDRTTVWTEPTRGIVWPDVR